MHIAKGRIDEIFIQDGRAGRIACPPALIPAPGQYLLAHADSDPSAPLPHPVFKAGNAAGGFLAAAPLPVTWTPGTELTLRGPLGRGFTLPAQARKVALASFGDSCSRLLALLEPALAQNAEITLLTAHSPANIPPSIEILPATALSEIIPWADYLAIDIPAQSLPQLNLNHLTRGYATEILIETPMPCGGIGECGVCAIHTRKSHLLACKDGPVFDISDLQ